MAQPGAVQEVAKPAGEASSASETQVQAPAPAPAPAPVASAPAATEKTPPRPVGGTDHESPPPPTVTVPKDAVVVEKGPLWAAEDGRTSFKDILTGSSVVVALLALIFSAYTRWRTANQAYYAHLSKVWYDLRKEELKCPEWLDASRTSMYGLGASEDPPSAYEAHAWSCWALAEDWYETHGRPRWFHRLSRAARFKALFPNELSQFEGTVRSVTELHWAWLQQRPEHLRRFDARFVSWIRTRFVEARAEKLDVSTIANAGAGVRAREALLRGQFIGFLEGEVAAARGTHTLQMGEDIHLLLNEPLCFLNHSSTPNAVVRGRSLFAWQDIPAGGEIFIDYACTEESFSFGPGPDLGYASLSEPERKLREDRLHAWLQDRRKKDAGRRSRRSI